MMLRLYVYMSVFVRSILVCSAALMSAYNYAMRIFGYLDRQATILTYSGRLKTPPILYFPSPSI